MNIAKILSNNRDLPELPAWQARSFWAMALAVVATGANALGVDLFGFLGEIGAGATPDEVIATGERAISAWQSLAPLVLGLWAWIERRAPNYRLTLFRKADQGGALHFLGAILIVLTLAGSVLVSSTVLALAQGARCMPDSQLVAVLADDYDEVVVGAGTAGPDRRVLLFANVRSGTWTMVVLVDGSACVIAAGEGWMAEALGDPA